MSAPRTAARLAVGLSASGALLAVVLATSAAFGFHDLAEWFRGRTIGALLRLYTSAIWRAGLGIDVGTRLDAFATPETADARGRQAAERCQDWLDHVVDAAATNPAVFKRCLCRSLWGFCDDCANLITSARAAERPIPWWRVIRCAELDPQRIEFWLQQSDPPATCEGPALPFPRALITDGIVLRAPYQPSDVSTPTPLVIACAQCETTLSLGGRKLLQCAGCPAGSAPYYCDATCQRKDWKSHRRHCASKASSSRPQK